MNARPALRFAVPLLAMLAMLALAATLACRTSAAPAGTPAPRSQRDAQLPAGLTMRPALVLVHLDEDRRFKWVAPESLVRGLTAEDIASVTSAGAARLRESVQTVVFANGWRLVADSADYELAVFTVARTEMRPETRTEQTTTATSGLPRCDESRGGAQPACSNNPVNSRTYVVHVPATVRLIYHVVRRRADGAVRVWVNPAGDIQAVDATVARDLLRLFLSRDPG